MDNGTTEALREVEKGAASDAGLEQRPRGWTWLVRTYRFVREKRMYGPRYWRWLYRFIRFKILHPRVKTEGFISVSYTHLTLPTIYSV